MTNSPTNAPDVWCRRNAEGQVIALTRQTLSAAERLAGGWDAQAPSAAEVGAFMRDVSSHANELRQTDSDLARVLEDLIDALITRGLIQFTDLPQAAQAKLLERRQTRANLTHRLQLLPLSGETDSGLI
jgi:hypothetical protein